MPRPQKPKPRPKRKTPDPKTAAADPDHWRLIVDFPPDLATRVKAEAERLGVNFQATVKSLIDEALRSRESQPQQQQTQKKVR